MLIEEKDMDTAKKRVGRPQGELSVLLNRRVPVSLIGQLDRYLDRLETQTGLKSNRGMLARRALEVFLQTHAHEVYKP